MAEVLKRIQKVNLSDNTPIPEEQKLSTSKARIAQCIMEGKIEEALSILATQYPSNSDVGLLEFRFHNNQRAYSIQAIIDKQTYDLTNNQIAEAVLEMSNAL